MALESVLTIEFNRAAGRLVNWVLEGGDDLVSFEALESGFDIEIDTATLLGYKIIDTSTGKKFFRIRATSVD